MDFKTQKYDMTIVIDGEKYDATSYGVVIPNAWRTSYGFMDAVINCHDGDDTTDVLHFDTEADAQKWIDTFGGSAVLRFEHGNELHAYVPSIYVAIVWDSKDVLTRKPIYFKDFRDESECEEYAKDIWESMDDEEKLTNSVEVIRTTTADRKDPHHLDGYLYYQDGDDFC